MPQERRHDMGAGGTCICPKCGQETPHHRGVPCQDERCPACGSKLLRTGSYHHQLLKERQGGG
jgi:predicted amidophosphoribosyltransferase